MKVRPLDQMNLVAFQNQFGTNEACEEYLFHLRWPEGFICPQCGCSSFYRIQSRRVYQCSSCRHQVSITAGTMMHKSKVPLQKWFWAIYLCVTDKRGISATALQAKIGVSYPTAWFLLHKIRAGMAERDNQYLLNGEVEMDDCYVGGRSARTPGTADTSGCGSDKARVIVALSLVDGKPDSLRMKVLDDQVTQQEVNEFAMTAIAPGTHITTDGHSSYNKLKSLGFSHTAKAFYKEGPEFLKWLHVIISNMKSFISGTFHGLSDTHLQAYLDEFCYRFSRRHSRLGQFDRLVIASINASHLKWNDLVAGRQ